MNVVVIACNGLHLGFLGMYGNGWIHTPELDRLAAEGVVFDHHYAENLTTIPTRRSWWTGRYGFTDSEQGWTPLRHDESILPDVLWDRGVRSALISDVPMLREAGQGFGRGFDEVRWIRGAGYDPYIPAADPRGGKPRLRDEPGFRLPNADDPNLDLWKERWLQYLRNRHALTGNAGPRTLESTTTARVVKSAVSWLDNQGPTPDPFVLWIDLFAPHGPWDPPPPFRDQYALLDPEAFARDSEGDLADATLAGPNAQGSRTDLADVQAVRALIDVPGGWVGDVLSDDELFRLRRTYAGAVSMLDTALAPLLALLRTPERLRDTLVVFTGDQGEPLGEHGYVRRYVPWLYEELIHTPLVLRLPAQERAGTRVAGLAQTVDLFPTILSALNLTPVAETQGCDLLPMARGEVAKTRDFICMGMDTEEFAVRTADWHYILPVPQDDDDADEDDEPRKPELYRKPEDRWDRNNVIQQNPDIAEDLELTLRRFIDAVEHDTTKDVPPPRYLTRE